MAAAVSVVSEHAVARITALLIARVELDKAVLADPHKAWDIPACRALMRTREYYFEDPYLDVLFYPGNNESAVGGFFHDPVTSFEDRLMFADPGTGLYALTCHPSPSLLRAIRRVLEEPCTDDSPPPTQGHHT